MMVEKDWQRFKKLKTVADGWRWLKMIFAEALPTCFEG